MTVAELIELLVTFPPDAPVGHISTGGVYETVDIVRDMDAVEREFFGTNLGVVLL